MEDTAEERISCTRCAGASGRSQVYIALILFSLLATAGTGIWYVTTHIAVQPAEERMAISEARVMMRNDIWRGEGQQEEWEHIEEEVGETSGQSRTDVPCTSIYEVSGVRKKKETATIYYRGGEAKYQGEVRIQSSGGSNAISRFVGPERAVPEGLGEMKIGNSSRYMGDWVDGFREGCGIQVTQGKFPSLYHGTWKQDKMTGWGKMIYSTGAEYRGEFVNGLYHGKGVLTWHDGITYSGMFLYGWQDGPGTIIYSDGSRYTGTWRMGNTTGRGVLRLSPTDCMEVVWTPHQPSPTLYRIPCTSLPPFTS